MSMVIFTSLPTSTPPASSAAFQTMPKSSRLILVVAVAPTRVLPNGSLDGRARPSTSSTTSLRDAVNGQVSSDGEVLLALGFDRLGLEGQLRELLASKKSGLFR